MVLSILFSALYTVSIETQLKLTHTHLWAHQKNVSTNRLSERWRAPWEFECSQQQRERRKHLAFKADGTHLQLLHRKLRDRRWKTDRVRDKEREFGVFDVRPHSRDSINPSDGLSLYHCGSRSAVTMATRAWMVDRSWRVWMDREGRKRVSNCSQVPRGL